MAQWVIFRHLSDLRRMDTAWEWVGIRCIQGRPRTLEEEAVDVAVGEAVEDQQEVQQLLLLEYPVVQERCLMCVHFKIERG